MCEVIQKHIQIVISALLSKSTFPFYEYITTSTALESSFYRAGKTLNRQISEFVDCSCSRLRKPPCYVT